MCLIDEGSLNSEIKFSLGKSQELILKELSLDIFSLAFILKTKR